ncbi:MAG: YraN family protein [Patescibacteria group bacterium]
MDTKELGFLAENIAARYLEGRGYEVIDRNYRKPWGEVDIIVSKEEVIIFVEVKSSNRESEGLDPEVRVDWKKIAKIKRVAAFYLESEFGDMDREWQIDIVSITFNSIEKKAKIKHFKNI